MVGQHEQQYLILSPHLVFTNVYVWKHHADANLTSTEKHPINLMDPQSGSNEGELLEYTFLK